MSVLPHLSLLAKKYLCICASSSPYGEGSQLMMGSKRGYICCPSRSTGGRSTGGSERYSG